jgi:serine O-acetyltransferase
LLDHFRADIRRLRRYGATESTARLLLFNQGLWACGCYRFGRHLNDHPLWPGLHQVVKAGYLFWWKWVEMATGISISPDCRIAPGLYIGHFGQIILHSDVVLGRDCNLSQGVTLGLAEKGGRWGVPTLGDRVYIAPGAKVVGPIHLADGTVVGANAVVVDSTNENEIVAGIPARVINTKGSGTFIQPE